MAATIKAKNWPAFNMISVGSCAVQTEGTKLEVKLSLHSPAFTQSRLKPKWGMSGRREGLTHAERYVSQVGISTAPRVPSPLWQVPREDLLANWRRFPAHVEAVQHPEGPWMILMARPRLHHLWSEGALGLGTRHHCWPLGHRERRPIASR